MPLTPFHPLISRWFHERLGRPTPAQAGGWAAIREGQHTLIAAPTGSGKTLAAFLSALDDLLREGLERASRGQPELPDETRVLYVSPLKALSADIHRNLAEPRREIRKLAEAQGLPPVRITAAVRSGDTPQAERAAMLKTPPHILVTTPESLYLLLTAERSRAMLSTVQTVIIDEVHAVIESRRGAHLALSLERLEHVTGRPLQRIGLSATQRPIERVASFLVGAREDGLTPPVRIIDEGHARARDLALEVTGSPLEAVMSAEAWEEVYDRLASLVREHRTTLVFVNTRRLCERLTRHLSERLGDEVVATHHGSLSKEQRLDAEERLKAGTLKVLVATASLELGIDIGHVDLVCQIGSPRRVATFLQRVGRSGHTVGGTPKGRLFPLSRDELVECAALLRLVRRGELDHLIVPEKPLDVLAQQIVAEAAAQEWAEDALFALVRRADPYRSLSRAEFDAVVAMVGRGYATRRGRRSALVHRDAVNRRLRARRGSRLLALTAGGAIPELADYRVLLEPEGTFIGTVNEDFAIESMAGDIFQLGNRSYIVLRVQSGVVRVGDADGAPPNIPFWLGEAPSRSAELSAAVAELREQVDAWIDAERADAERADAPRPAEPAASLADRLAAVLELPAAGAQQLAAYLAEAKRVLGVLPTQHTLVLERFFDESGGMQLVLHAPFGARVNRAWGLALRKKFCRTFNFELQAAATDEGVLLSLGPQHSFPLEDVFRYLNPAVVRDTLVQAVLDAPLFQVRWRWNATISLAVPRSRAGAKVPPPIQRMQAEDLLAAVFPDAAACLENIAGDREVPEHPLVRQALDDCLTEAMDLPALERVLADLFAGRLTLVARDLPEPSPLASQLLNARVFEFLDDAPLEERRAQAVYTRRALEPTAAADLGALDAAAIERVREEAWPSAENADELHDALEAFGFLGGGGGGESGWADSFAELTAQGRAASVSSGGATWWVAAERLREIVAVHPAATIEPRLTPPAGFDAPITREEAIRELIRGRLEIVGPTTATALAMSLAIAEADVERTLLALEAEGVVLRGAFSGGAEREWCDRRLLARIHRYTLDRLRAEIRPVEASDFLRFLFRWQHVDPDHRLAGAEGVMAAIEQLAGFELPAGSWEGAVLAARCEHYEPEQLDLLCLSGRIAWGRLSAPTVNGSGTSRATPLRTSPVTLWPRETGRELHALAPAAELVPSAEAAAVAAVLNRRGASFFHQLVAETALLPTQVERALGELVALGHATADGFAGLRALLTPSHKRAPLTPGRRRATHAAYSVATAGRWSALRETVEPAARQEGVESFARALLRRYGVVFRALLAREALAPSWRELALVYRRLEARGEIRGGRFVNGFSGEQFALAEAVSGLRQTRRAQRSGRLLAIGAGDPLNLAGILTPGERIPATSRATILWRDGVPVAAVERGELRVLAGAMAPAAAEVHEALGRSTATPRLRSYLRSRPQPGRRAGAAVLTDG
ncbi:MAG: DEAD/DEAH box helicase [Longimicrobiales bacterium]